MTVTVTLGRRRASATTNVLDDASLRRTVDLATRLARLAPEDPELMPELGAQTYSAPAAFVARTADLDPEARATAVRRAVDAANAAGEGRRGRCSAPASSKRAAASIAVATSAGLFAYHRSTEASFSVTARTPDGTGSGWAGAGARDWSAIDPAAIGRIAAQKAVASRNPQAIEPGLYTAVLEPQAVNDLVPLLGARAQRADRRRRAQPVLEARRRHAHRREGDGRRGSRSTRIPPIRGCSVSRSTARACRSARWCGSRRASCAISPTSGSGPRRQDGSRPARRWRADWR